MSPAAEGPRHLALLAALVLVPVGCGGAGAGPVAGDPVADGGTADLVGLAEQAAPDAAVIVRSPPPAGVDTVWLLSQTGLYADIATFRLAPDIIEFRPRHELWSDGAGKRRFVALPDGAPIDTADMDHWRFPVGTRFWKEFRQGELLLETRLIVRTGPGDGDYWMGAFQWDADGREARLTIAGATDVRGTDHEIPAAKQCASCHDAEPGRVLGFSAIQLSGAATGPGFPTLSSLSTAGRLSVPPPAGADFSPPGTGNVSAALGLLHANCGSCHSPGGIARPDTNMILRLSVAERDPGATEILRTTVGVDAKRYVGEGPVSRLVPGQPMASAVYLRMLTRNPRRQMPPLFTRHPDEQGLSIVRQFIHALPPP